MMDCPQLENGYTKIADTILERIAQEKLNGTQLRILLIVWRSTYGWGKKSYSLSESYLSKATGIHKQQIKRELKSMINEGILIEVEKPSFNTARVIAFNKRYQKSLEVSNKVPVSESDTPTGSGLDTSTGTLLDTQNKHINKHINKQCESDIFFEECWKLYPNKKGKGQISAKTKKDRHSLNDEFVRCIERYVRTKENWQKYQNGSTFWNSGYVDYLDNCFQEQEEEKTYDVELEGGGFMV